MITGSELQGIVKAGRDAAYTAIALVVLSRCVQ
jgi:hypothetical protein